MVNDENGNRTSGSLLYLAQSTRPDEAIAVNDVIRFNYKHSEHSNAMLRVIGYLKVTKDLILFNEK